MKNTIEATNPPNIVLYIPIHTKKQSNLNTNPTSKSTFNSGTVKPTILHTFLFTIRIRNIHKKNSDLSNLIGTMIFFWFSYSL